MEPGPGFYNPDFSVVLKKFPAIKFTQTKEKRSEIIPKEKMYISPFIYRNLIYNKN